ncbi:MAG: hypothetical protein ACXABY_10350, partial [Candidatus Thorarchaeota archaeon]
LRTKTDGNDLTVVSGMDTLWEIVPNDVKGLLQTLAVRLAEATKKKGSTTVWFDSAIPTADTSEVYKQHRVTLMPHDSPLRVYVDEIVLNHHIPPSRGISESPFADELRRIIRFTPTGQEDLGLVTISPLRGWSRRFRSEIRPGDEPFEIYSKGVRTPTSGQSTISKTFTNEELQDIVTPTRISETDVTINLPDRDTTLFSRLDIKTREFGNRTKGYKGVLSRIRLAQDFCNPKTREPTSVRKEPRFRSVRHINARRKNWTPRLHNEMLEESHLPPHESRLEVSKLLFKGAAKIEIQRILEAVAVLSRTTTMPFSSIKEFLRGFIERLNQLQLEGGGSDSQIADGLSLALRTIDYTSNIWWNLSYHRSNPFAWNVAPNIRLALKVAHQRDESISNRFGSYFIMLLSYLHDTVKDFPVLQLQELWDTLRPWLLIQMGAMQSESDRPKSVFDMQRVFQNLNSRVQAIDQMPQIQIPVFDEVRYGILVDSYDRDDSGEEEDPLHRWYIFEKTAFSHELVAGCVKASEREFDKTALIPIDEQVAAAAECYSKSLVVPILIGRTHGIDILYEPAEWEYYFNPSDLDFFQLDWSPRGHLRYGTRQVGALARLRWISTSYYGMFPEPQSHSLPRRPLEFAQRLFNHLSTVVSKHSGILRVVCVISGTNTEGTIEFLNLDGSLVGSLSFEGAARALKILRTPYDRGQPLVLGRKLLTWNPTTDVTYSSGQKQIEEGVVSGIV